MHISLFQIYIRDISFSYKIEISTFKIEMSVFQLQISVFKNKNWCLYLKHRYVSIWNTDISVLNAEITNFFKYRYMSFKHEICIKLVKKQN